MRVKAALVLNIAIVAIALGCCIYGFFFSGEGASFLTMYTRLSNIIAALACAFAIPYCVRALKSASSCKGLEMPVWLRVFKLAGLASVMVTFLTVFLLFGFMVGHLTLLHNTNLFFHLVSPLLMLVVCCVFERSSFGLRCRAVAVPIILTALYAAWYFVEVIVVGADNGGWRDFYGFNAGGMWLASLVAMMAATVVVSLVFWKLSGGRRR